MWDGFPFITKVDLHGYSSVPKRQVALQMRWRSAHASGTAVLASAEGTRV